MKDEKRPRAELRRHPRSEGTAQTKKFDHSKKLSELSLSWKPGSARYASALSSLVIVLRPCSVVVIFHDHVRNVPKRGTLLWKSNARELKRLPRQKQVRKRRKLLFE